MYSPIIKYSLAPLYDLVSGTRVMPCLKKLEESQWWPQNKILEWQNQRLRHLIRQAYHHTAFYRRVFDKRGLKPEDINTTEDLKKLPVLTKQTVKDNFSAFVADNISPERMVKRHTSGSTGEPLMFYTEKTTDITWSYAASQRAYGWSGYRVGDKCIHIGQKPEYDSMWEKSWETAKNYLERIRSFDVQTLSQGRIPEAVRLIETFKPQFIRGYPSAIYLIARFMEKEGEKYHGLKAVLTLAEKVEDYQRDLFRHVFSCEAFSLYSTHEAPNIAAECASHTGYHITAENIIVEIVDDQKIPLPPGKAGNILVTNLNNYCMPFIRYDIGDIGILSSQACDCGRGLPLLSRLDGRITDFIYHPDGSPMPGLALHQHFMCKLKGVAQWQIVQESYEKIIIKIVLETGCHPSQMVNLTAEIENHFRPLLGKGMDMKVVLADQIPLTRTGKRRFVISRIEHRP